MKFKTVREGQQAIIYNHLGEGKVVEGPVRLFLFRQRLSLLQRHSASQYQYLEVTYNTGDLRHIPGPCEMYQNPLEHSSVRVSNAIKIDASHMVVVYHRKPDNSVERRVVQGPTLFTPQATEWLHKFSWHGEDPNSVGHMIPNQCQFQELEVIPKQFYYNVRDVRTTDDTMLTVKLMIFYELVDVITMLEATHDPIADMINAVCADVIAFAGKLTFSQFLEQTQKLSDLGTFEQLVQRSGRVGCSVSKVVYRGYKASEQLQAMQDSAVQSRTQLRLSAELQDQKQRLVDLKLTKEQDRANLKQDMEKARVDHRQKVDQIKKTHEMALKEQELNTHLEVDRLEHDVNLECQQKQCEQQLEFLQSLKSLDVDVTKILVNDGPGPVDQELHIVPRNVDVNKQVAVATNV